MIFRLADRTILFNNTKFLMACLDQFLNVYSKVKCFLILLKVNLSKIVIPTAATCLNAIYPCSKFTNKATYATFSRINLKIMAFLQIPRLLYRNNSILI